MGKCTSYVFPNAPSSEGAEVDWDQPAANYLLGEYASFLKPGICKREAVHMEIRLETAMEGNRFFDLRRWGKLDEVIPAYIAKDSEFRSVYAGSCI